MRRWIVVFSLMVAAAGLPGLAPAQEPTATPPTPTTAPAQDHEAAAAAAEPGSDQNIFQSLQIELLDIDRLREEVGRKLVGEPIRMTLDQCVQMALMYNQD